MAHWIAALWGAHGLGNPSMLNAFGVLHLWPWFMVAAVASTPLAPEDAQGADPVLLREGSSHLLGSFSPYVVNLSAGHRQL